MKYQSALLILSIFATEYTSATRRDGLGAPAQSDLTVLDQDASDGVHILEELTTDPDSDAPTSSEHEYGFEREPINWNSLEKWSNPPSTNESAFERTDESMVGDAAVERELMETPTSTSGEPERDVKPIARRLRRRIEPAVEKRSNSDDKESLRDLTIPLFQPSINESGEFDMMPYAEPAFLAEHTAAAHDDGRSLQNNCGSGETFVKVEVLTDNSGFETSWKIHKLSGALAIAGPPEGTSYDDNMNYTGGICLGAGSYTFTVFDKFGDGMCGPNSGQGLYRLYLNGVEKFSSPSSCIDWAQRAHSFTIDSNSELDSSPSLPSDFQPESRSGCHNVRIEFKVDKYGKETTVLFQKNGVAALASREEVAAYQTKTMQACVPAGTYTFKLMDDDGICCRNGNGYYKLSVDGTPVINGGYFIGSKSYTIKVGYDWRSTMNARDQEWLEAHNNRRRIYNGGEGYVPLRWSRSLAYDAKRHAQYLLSDGDCKLTTGSHAKNTDSGENLASNEGTGSFGKLRTADQVMTRWVDMELDAPYKENLHFLQVVWRATKYVGCGESVRYLSNGGVCRIQVCRYERPGTCGVRDGNWRAEVWKDDTLCGNPCPNEGCYA